MTEPVAISMIGAGTTVIVTLLAWLRAERRWRQTSEYREWQKAEQEKESEVHTEIKSHLGTLVNGGLEKQIEKHLERHLTVAISREIEKLLPDILQKLRED